MAWSSGPDLEVEARSLDHRAGELRPEDAQDQRMLDYAVRASLAGSSAAVAASHVSLDVRFLDLAVAGLGDIHQ